MSEWKPIESAPRDGRDVLIWTDDGVRIGCFDRENDEWLPDDNPSHWQPLPPPPGTVGTGEADDRASPAVIVRMVDRAREIVRLAKDRGDRSPSLAPMTVLTSKELDAIWVALNCLSENPTPESELLGGTAPVGGRRIEGWAIGNDPTNCRFNDGTHTITTGDVKVRRASLVIHDAAPIGGA